LTCIPILYIRYKKKVIRKVLGYQMEIRSGKSKNDWQYSDQKIKGKQWSTKHSVGIAIINRTITYCNWYYYEQYLTNDWTSLVRTYHSKHIKVWGEYYKPQFYRYLERIPYQRIENEGLKANKPFYIWANLRFKQYEDGSHYKQNNNIL
jgi:hypothetical protein